MGSGGGMLVWRATVAVVISVAGVLWASSAPIAEPAPAPARALQTPDQSTVPPANSTTTVAPTTTTSTTSSTTTTTTAAAQSTTTTASTTTTTVQTTTTTTAQDVVTEVGDADAASAVDGTPQMTG